MMREHFFKILVLFAVMFSACEKYTEVSIPADVPRLSGVQQQYKDKLVGSTNGWYIDYQPVAGAGKISILMKFSQNGTAKIISDYSGYTTEQTEVRYRIGGVTAPELIFETYSVWHALNESMGGAFEFNIADSTNGNLSLKNIKGVVIQQILRKATANDQTDLVSKITTIDLLESFSRNASGYFKNLILTSISAFWEINPSSRTLKLTWLDDTGTQKSEQFTYYHSGSSIILSSPWKPKNLDITGFTFGQANPNQLLVTAAGTAGSGRIEVAHVPAFPYKGTADYFMQENGTVRFYSYTLATNADYYSPALEVEFLKLKSKFSDPTTFLTQFYNHNGTAPNFTNSIQFRYVLPAGITLPDGSTSGWLPYYYTLTKLDESHVVVTQTGATNIAGTPFLADVNEFLAHLFPAEGVTIIPNGRAGALQKIRIISRKDSKYYINTTVSTPAGIYLD